MWPKVSNMIINTLRSRQNGRYFPYNVFNRIFFNENAMIKILLKFVPEGAIDNKSTLVWVMAWRRTGDKPLSEPNVS